jgi:hypothetical protein
LRTSVRPGRDEARASTDSRVRHAVVTEATSPKRPGSSAQHLQIADRDLTIGDGHIQIEEHVAPVMAETALLGRRPGRR